MVNCIYSLVGRKFSDFVALNTDARNEKLAMEKKLVIDMDPSIAKCFQDSHHISSKCSFHSLQCQ